MADENIWEKTEKADRLGNLGYGNMFADSLTWQLLQDLNRRLKILERKEEEK